MSANTPTRKFRCPNPLWQAAQTQATTENTTISEQIRAWLTTWTEQDTK